MLRNSLRKSAADFGRAAGSLAIARRINWAKSGVTFGLTASNGGGAALRCFISSSLVVVPVKGGLPEINSWNVQPEL